MTKILNAYYTNDIKDNIKVTYETDEDGVYEMDIEPGSAEAIELEAAGWNHEKLLDTTAEYKREQLSQISNVARITAQSVYEEQIATQEKKLEAVKRKARDIRKNIVSQELLIKEKDQQIKEKNQQIADSRKTIVSQELIIKEKLAQSRKELLSADLVHKQQLKQQKESIILQHAMLKRIEQEAPQKIETINKFLASNLSKEKINIALNNYVSFVKTLNDDPRAIDIILDKAGSDEKPKTLLDATKLLM